MGMRWQEDAERASMVYASWKSGQRGRTLLSSRQCVTTALLPPDAARRSAHLCPLEQEHQRSLERKQRPGSQVPAWRASVRQGVTGLPQVFLVILPPHAFGVHASVSCGCPVGACADARPHSVQGIETGVPEGCLRCYALGSSAPRRESAPTAQRTDLCWSFSSPEYSGFPASHGEALLLLLLPGGQALLRILRDQTAPATVSVPVG